MFDNQSSLTEAKIFEYAKSLGLDMKAFDKAYKDKLTLETIQNDRKQGETIGVAATPALFVNGRPLKLAPTLPNILRRIAWNSIDSSAISC